MYAYDDRTAIACGVDAGLECAIPGRTLLDLLEGASDALQIEQKGAEVILTDKGSTIRLPTLSRKDFVFSIPEERTEHSFKLDAQLISALEVAAANANREAIRPNLMGVTLAIEGKRLILYSTDNVTCTKVAFSPKGGARGPFTTILPRESVELIAQTYSAMKDSAVKATIAFGKTIAQVDYEAEGFPAVTLYAKTIQAEPQDFESIIAGNSKGATFVDCASEELSKAIRRANIVMGQEVVKYCVLEPQDNAMLITAKGPLGEIKAKVRLKGLGAGASYAVNPELMSRALEHCSQIGFGGKALTLTNDAEGVETLILIAKDASAEKE